MINNSTKFCLIIGAMKSGTTNLFSLLSQHPEIISCNPKEPQFFSKQDEFDKGLDFYYSLFKQKDTTQHIALEASTSYTKIPNFTGTTERIKKSGINAKFIYIMRNPFDRIQSQIQMSRCNGWAIYNEDGDLHKNVIGFSKYHMQLVPYFNNFPSENILLLSLDELKSSPHKTMKKVCRFLDISKEFKFNIKAGDKHAGYRYSYRDTFIVRKVFGIKSYDEYRDFLKENPNSIKRARLLRHLQRKNKLSSKDRIYINKMLSDDMGSLRKDFKFDTSIWGF